MLNISTWDERWEKLNQIDRNVEGIHYINIARRRRCGNVFFCIRPSSLSLSPHFISLEFECEYRIYLCFGTNTCEFLTVTYDVCEIHCDWNNKFKKKENMRYLVSRCETNSLGQMKHMKEKPPIDQQRWQKTCCGMDIILWRRHAHRTHSHEKMHRSLLQLRCVAQVRSQTSQAFKMSSLWLSGGFKVRVQRPWQFLRFSGLIFIRNPV